jgi:FemAB-related protein (PEP-CTERM system-associated)
MGVEDNKSPVTTAIKIRVLRPEDGASWNELVAQNPRAKFYHLWEWGEILASTYGYKRYYLAAEQDQTLVGVFPLIYVKSLLFSNRLISLPLCEYGGPLTAPTLEDHDARQVMQKLLLLGSRLAESLGVTYLETRGVSDGMAYDMLRTAGCQPYQNYTTFELDLGQPVEELWRNLDKKTRNATRKAIDREVKTVEVRDDHQLEAYYSLYLEVQKRHGSPPHGYAFFKRLFEVFRKKDMIRITLAEYQGNAIAGIAVLHFGNTIYWISSVTDVEHRSLNASNLLMWKAIEQGSAGKKILDFGRTRADSTIHHFKKGWGGKEVTLTDHMLFFGKARTPPDPSQRRYVYLSQLWSLMPVAASSRLGHHLIGDIAL